MGAEMLITSIAFRRGKTQAHFKRIVEGVLEKAKRKIEEAKTIGDLDQYEEYYGGPRVGESLDTVKKTLLSDLEEVRCGIHDSHREACLIEGGRGILLLASGGESWGNEPSRLYGSINRLHAAGVIEDARYLKTKGIPMKKKRLQVAIVVEDGLITGIRSTHRKLDVFVLDHDNAADPAFDADELLEHIPVAHDPSLKCLAEFRQHYAKVCCSICHNLCLARSAHLHQQQWIGDACCWIEQLRSSE